MFINFGVLNKVLEKHAISETDIFKLVAIKNKDVGAIEERVTEEELELFLEKGLIKYVKPKNKSQTKYELVRLEKVSEKFLVDISTNLFISEEVEKIFKYLETIYKGRSSGIVKNKTETKRRINWFINESGIGGNRLAILIKSFCADTYDPSLGRSIEDSKEDNPRLVLSFMLDNVFWTPKDNFARHYKLEESPLYTYLEDNYEYIDKIWKHFEEQGKL